MKTALIFHPIYLRHETGPHHPERASRLQAILRKLKKTGLIESLRLIEPGPASTEDIALVHNEDYILAVNRACRKGHANLDPDTIVSADSFKAALFGVGGVIKGIDMVMKGDIDNAFCLLRPPGHHAGPSHAMGFCIFNNIAVGARYLETKYRMNRILILDWDVHHGNGTEEIFYEDPRVFYISLHQYPHYPGTGPRESTGAKQGKGFNLNIPMKAGSGDREYMTAFREIIIPRIEDFKPEFILISAGFDGHANDPLSSINLTEKGYSRMTEIVKKSAGPYACNRIVSILEGGYDLFSLAGSAHSHLEALIST